MEEKQEKHIAGAKVFVPVWLALLALTALTVAASGLQLGKWSVTASLLIASVKAGLVLWFFMHLKYERWLLRLMIIVPVATITFIIYFTFLDVWYR